MRDIQQEFVDRVMNIIIEAECDKIAKPDCIFASNTSTMRVTDLAKTKKLLNPKVDALFRIFESCETIKAGKLRNLFVR